MSIFSDPPGVFLQDKSSLNSPSSSNVQGHSWFGKTAHILRPGRKVIRCTIGEFVLEQCFVGLNVRFQENGTKKTKNVCPIMLRTVNLFWHANEFGSDEEDISVTKIVPPSLLPELRIWHSEKSKFSSQQLKAMQWSIAQTDLLLKQYLPPNTDIITTTNIPQESFIPQEPFVNHNMYQVDDFSKLKL